MRVVALILAPFQMVSSYSSLSSAAVRALALRLVPGSNLRDVGERTIFFFIIPHQCHVHLSSYIRVLLAVSCYCFSHSLSHSSCTATGRHRST